MTAKNTPSPVTQLAQLSTVDRLNMITNAFILFCRGLHRTVQPGMGRWHKNDNETEIYIAGMEPDEGEALNNKPRIIVQRLAAQWGGRSIGQQQTFGIFTGSKIFTDLISCPVVIRCIAREGLEAQRIAWDLSRMILVFRPEIYRAGRMQNINTGKMQISAETAMGAGVIRSSPNPEYKEVSLVLPVFFEETVVRDDSEFYAQIVAVLTGTATAD
tara:strand:+ start:246 stop:890 length:645 start_codon:yes stop_codon:yes gene_type:complete